MPLSTIRFNKLLILLLSGIVFQLIPLISSFAQSNPGNLTDTVVKPLTRPANIAVSRPDSLAGDSLDPFGFPLQNPQPVRQPVRQVISQPTIVEPDSLPASAIKWFTESQLQNPFALRPNYIDTTLLGFQMYDYAYQGHYFVAQKGNPGHVHRQLLYNPLMNTGLITGERELYGNYMFTHDNLKFYRPKHVFTEMCYIIGGEREQLFFANHAQKLSDNLNMNFQYRLVHSPGVYTRIGARNSGVYLTADYLSPNKRYQVLGSLITNRVRSQESGGLRNLQAFETDRNSDSVFLYRSETVGRETSFNLRHFYQTGFYFTDNDDNTRKFLNLGRINHDFSYTRTSFVMNAPDKDRVFFPFPDFSMEDNYDSTFVHRFENQLSWSNFPLSGGRFNFPFNFKLYIKNSINRILQTADRPEGAPILNEDRKRIYYYTQDQFNSVIQGIELQSDQRLLLSFGGYANITLGGYNDDDFHAGAFLRFGKPDKNYYLEAMARYSRMEAPYFLNKFSVNDIRWDNNISKMDIANARAILTLPFVKLEGNYYLINRAIYFGKDFLPVQNNDETGFFSLAAYSDVKAGPFGFRNHILLQQSTDKNFERYPTLTSYHSVFANFNLSDKALVNQVGFDFHFNTPYNAMAYNPFIRGFYLQDSYTNAGKYMVDVFWNAKIKNARLFIKYQNLLPLVFNIPPHYDIPFYPIPESMFKFGVSWMFFN